MSITTAQLVEMKRVAEATLTQTCTINRISEVDTPAGGFDDTLAEVASGVACRLAIRTGAMLNADIAQRNQRVTSLTEYTLRVATTQDIEPDDQVVIGGETYKVEGVWDEHQWVVLKSCKVTRF